MSMTWNDEDYLELKVRCRKAEHEAARQSVVIESLRAELAELQAVVRRQCQGHRRSMAALKGHQTRRVRMEVS